MRAWILCAAIAAMPISSASDGPSGSDYLTFTASSRLRGEYVEWFEPQAGAASRGAREYGFFAHQLRLGVRATFPHVQAVVEVQDTRLLGLPNDATLAPPIGSLGPGASYFAHTREGDQGETFLKQGFVTLRRSGWSASAGRQDYADGAETTPGNRTLAWVKKTRVAERLIGPFGYTHVTRSFDAVRASYDAPAWNATAFAGYPTRGGFEVSANRSMTDIGVAGLALTAKGTAELPPFDLRGFYLFYEDSRDRPVRVDNRPAPVRTADRTAISVHTAGAHALGAFEVGPGTLDALAWGALQEGDWGRQDHFAWAHTLELGYQLRSLPATPWLRVGWNRSSGDRNPTDGDHETFFQLLPTARLYAQFPFFNGMNSDLFAQLLLQPHALIAIRTDYHWLRTTSHEDLWYSGGGASNTKIFGFGGIPTGGERELGHLVDVGVTLGPWHRFSLGVYYGHVFESSAVRNSFDAKDANYLFAELSFRY
jgi:hypothetical protein